MCALVSVTTHLAPLAPEDGDPDVLAVRTRFHQMKPSDLAQTVDGLRRKWAAEVRAQQPQALEIWDRHKNAHLAPEKVLANALKAHKLFLQWLRDHGLNFPNAPAGRLWDETNPWCSALPPEVLPEPPSTRRSRGRSC